MRYPEPILLLEVLESDELAVLLELAVADWRIGQAWTTTEPPMLWPTSYRVVGVVDQDRGGAFSVVGKTYQERWST